MATRETEPVALFDMDATLADFDYGMRTKLATLRGPQEPSFEGASRNELPDYIKARRSMIKLVPGFWEHLPRIEAGFEVFRLATEELGFTPHVLTKGPVKSTNAWTEKVHWCQREIPGTDITITQDKGLVYGRVLVDDWPDYILGWLAWRPRGLVVMLDWPHNRQVIDENDNLVDFEHPNVFRYHQCEKGSPQWLDQYGELTKKLIEARDR